MAKRGKKYLEAAKLIDRSKAYQYEEALSLVGKTSTTKFDASVDVSFRLNVDPRYAEQQVRGAIVLPHGTGKSKRYLQLPMMLKQQKLLAQILPVAKKCLKKSPKKIGLVLMSLLLPLI